MRGGAAGPPSSPPRRAKQPVCCPLPRGRSAGVRPFRAGRARCRLRWVASRSGHASPKPRPEDVRPRGPPRLSHAPQRRRRAGRHGAPRGRALTRSAPRGRRAAGGGGPRARDRRRGTEASGIRRRADGRGKQGLRLRSPKRDHVDSTAFRTQVSDPTGARMRVGA